MSRAPAGTAPRQKRRWFRALLLTALLLLAVPILQVGCVRFVDPPFAMPMLLRDAASKGPRQYAWIPLELMPRPFLQAVVAAEDQRFFQHHGFDWREIDRARRTAKRSGRPARGASTITMQCARSLFLWQGRSWIRKAIESYYTLWMEALLPKRRILELYGNVIELGDGVYGLEAGALHHYGRPAARLSRDECTMLAAILPSPRRWNPRQPSPKLAARQARIQRQAPAITLPFGGAPIVQP